MIENKLRIKASCKRCLKSAEWAPVCEDLHSTCGSLTGSWPSWGSRGPSRTGSGTVWRCVSRWSAGSSGRSSAPGSPHTRCAPTPGWPKYGKRTVQLIINSFTPAVLTRNAFITKAWKGWLTQIIKNILYYIFWPTLWDLAMQTVVVSLHRQLI